MLRQSLKRLSIKRIDEGQRQYDTRHPYIKVSVEASSTSMDFDVPPCIKVYAGTDEFNRLVVWIYQ